MHAQASTSKQAGAGTHQSFAFVLCGLRLAFFCEKIYEIIVLQLVNTTVNPYREWRGISLLTHQQPAN